MLAFVTGLRQAFFISASSLVLGFLAFEAYSERATASHPTEASISVMLRGGLVLYPLVCLVWLVYIYFLLYITALVLYAMFGWDVVELRYMPFLGDFRMSKMFR